MKCGKNAAWLLFTIIITALIANLTQTGVVKAWDYLDTEVSADYHGKSRILDPKLTPGTEFTVNITVNYVDKLRAYQFALGEPGSWEANPAKYQGWNASILNLLSVESGPFLGSRGGNVEWYPGEINSTQGTLSLTIGSLEPPTRFPTGGGTLATLTFEVVGMGGSPIRFGLDSGLLNSAGGFEFDGVWLRGTPAPRPQPGEPPLNHTDFLVDGYFDNRPLVRVYPEEVEGISVAQNFTIDVEVLNIARLHNWTFSMKWDATLLNVTSVTEGDFLSSNGTTYFDPGEIDTGAGEINDVSASLTNPTGEVSGDGTLASLTFDVLAVGTSSLNFSNVALYDSAEEKIDVGIIDGSFTNVEYHLIVVDVSVDPTKVKEGSGESMSVDVMVSNTGSFNETRINVTAYWMRVDAVERTNLGNKTIPLLIKDSNDTSTFIWDTTDVSRGKYRISVDAVGDDVTASGAPVDVTIYAHDVAIHSVATNKGTVYSGDTCIVTIVVKNEGTESETFDVTAYYDGNEIGTSSVTDLDYEEEKNILFTWYTTGVDIGNYTISAEAEVVAGEEAEDTDNNRLEKPDKVAVVPAPVGGLSTELLILIVVVIVVVVAIAIFYLRRRKPPET